jgi:amidase
MGDLALASATEQLAHLRAGHTSSRDLVEHYLERIKTLNGRVNAVVAWDAVAARTAADASDRIRASGAPLGPLHGLPITIKDNQLTQGLPTTYGTRRHRGPDVDDRPVARLRAAGGIIMGKTNTPPFARDIQTYNRRFGTTKNPWDPARTSGGSSGGAAAAVAAGLTGLELGNDLGGSIRLPAAYCGVYGHKPSWGLVSQPAHPSANPRFHNQMDIAVTGPIARGAEDLALALDVLAGPGPFDEHAVRIELPPPRARSLDGYRVAVWLSDPACRTEPEVRDRLDDAVSVVRASGATVTEARPDLDLKRAFATYQHLLYGALGNGLPTRFLVPVLAAGALLDPLGTLIGMAPVMVLSRQASRAVQGGLMSHRRWIRLDEARQELRRAWQRFFEDHDVLLCPASPVVAPRHNHRWGSLIIFRTMQGGRWRRRYVDQMVWAGIVGMAYLPATVAPVGQTSGGLPVGVQIVGPYLEDRTPIEFARLLAEVMGGFGSPPGFA